MLLVNFSYTEKQIMCTQYLCWLLTASLVATPAQASHVTTTCPSCASTPRGVLPNRRPLPGRAPTPDQPARPSPTARLCRRPRRAPAAIPARAPHRSCVYAAAPWRLAPRETPAWSNKTTVNNYTVDYWHRPSPPGTHALDDTGGVGMHGRRVCVGACNAHSKRLAAKYREPAVQAAQRAPASWQALGQVGMPASPHAKKRRPHCCPCLHEGTHHGEQLLEEHGICSLHLSHDLATNVGRGGHHRHRVEP